MRSEVTCERQPRSWITRRKVSYVHLVFGGAGLDALASRSRSRSDWSGSRLRVMTHFLQLCAEHRVVWAAEVPDENAPVWSPSGVGWSGMRKSESVEGTGKGAQCRYGRTSTSCATMPLCLALQLGPATSADSGRAQFRLSCLASLSMVLRQCLKTGSVVATAPASAQKRAPARAATARKDVRACRMSRRLNVATGTGFLRDLRVAPATREKYRDVLGEIALHNGISFDALLEETPEEVDAHVEAYVDRRFVANGDRSEGGYVKAAIAHFVWSLRDPHMLPLTKASVQGWKRFEPDSARLPCPWLVALLIARWLSQQQDAAMLQSARAVVLQFDLMARPGEIVNVLKDAVCMPRRHAGAAYKTPAVIFAPSAEVVPLHLGDRPTFTKTGEQDDTVAVDSASFVGVDSVLRVALCHARRQPHPRLVYLLTYPLYAKHVAAAGRGLHMPFRVSPHMFRHGGAS